MKERRLEKLGSDRALESTRTGRRAGKQRYRRPRLVEFGDVRTLTLGGSPGMGDSGPTTMVRKPL